jgi:hypothetical protein
MIHTIISQAFLIPASSENNKGGDHQLSTQRPTHEHRNGGNHHQQIADARDEDIKHAIGEIHPGTSVRKTRIHCRRASATPVTPRQPSTILSEPHVWVGMRIRMQTKSTEEKSATVGVKYAFIGSHWLLLKTRH